MSLNRRRFIHSALLGSASFGATSGLFFPKPAESYKVDFSLAELSTQKVLKQFQRSISVKTVSSGAVFSGFRRFSAADVLPGELERILSNRFTAQLVNQGEANVIRAADSTLQRNNFVRGRTELARAGQGVATSLLWGRQRQETVGPNPGFGFVQEFRNTYFDSKLSGATVTGIHLAQQILADQRVSANEIAGSVLPVRSTYEDLGSWEGEPSSRTAFAQYNTALGRFTVRYDAVDYRPGGRGEIRITMEGESIPTRNVLVTVLFTNSGRG